MSLRQIFSYSSFSKTATVFRTCIVSQLVKDYCIGGVYKDVMIRVLKDLMGGFLRPKIRFKKGLLCFGKFFSTEGGGYKTGNMCGYKTGIMCGYKTNHKKIVRE